MTQSKRMSLFGHTVCLPIQYVWAYSMFGHTVCLDIQYACNWMLWLGR